ncbi:DedA family protein [Heyndrickxia acidiproducens]|uniref:DedA family protein n=1 Tax=Heyndrickxia acidiproducens TaxID=1121084 RepID=UPI00037AE455|nr:VTT domain-containing protein [Heyndrickxia acidiproducens]
MFQHLIEILQGLGIYGVYAVMFLEGASIPFPGIFIILSYGYVLKLTAVQIAFSAGVMSLIYTAASFIPYTIALKLQNRIPPKFQKGIAMGQQLFNRFGVWSIALTRPFSIGNYISYAAGLCKVRKWKYFLLTFTGIYPWSFAVLFLGKSYALFLEKIGGLFPVKQHGLLAAGLGVLLFFCLVGIGGFFMKRWKFKGKE